MADQIHCGWAPADDALYRNYHDTEWGVPEYDSRALWEKLQLDGMQAGLSWITILRKRETMREEFDGFDPEKIAVWDEQRIEKALQNPGIIRSPKKIEACIGNARAYLEMQDRGEDFSDWCWDFVDGKPIVHHFDNYRDSPTKTDISEDCSKALKKQGYKFVGPTIVYAWMQACGLYNDHEVGCPRHTEVQELTR
ncbi:DNA-3-methyladenine glycosylase I [Hyphomonas sp. FCG-A18]|uniref:DNA-3-methyladenine glycosylase I n=1 Tax=Hyphomonas sp. FCG-A18 TaxID=3080019 RepID=UPI002B30F345|nr:DNA-3-methyladenine glycosylase I [Hyphomonas sp. FCG-A18]